MQVTTRRLLIAIALLVVLLTGAPSLGAAPPAQGAVTEEQFTVTLAEGWASQVKLTYPAGQPGPFPTLLLVMHPDVDSDFTIDGAPIYKDLAEFLAARGVAVARYNPRYVTGPGEYADEEKVFAQMPRDMVADAEAVLATLKGNSRVDPQRIFAFGWSFASLAAAELAASHPELAGLALVGPVSTTERQMFIEDYTEVVLPYLIGFAPDGRITPAVLEQAQAGDGGFITLGLMGFAFIDGSVTDRVAVNPFFDKDGDGVLDIGAEILPNLGAWVDQDSFVDVMRSIPNVYEQSAKLRQPVLVLQGELDGATRLRNTRGLNSAFAGHPDFTLKEYPGLGHSLSPVKGISYDRLTFYSEQPKADLATWVLARGTPAEAPVQPVALPNTGGPDLMIGWLATAALACLLVGTAVRRQVARGCE